MRLGTSKYQSKNVLKRNTPSRRDDLISVIYIVLELATGSLPWTTFEEELIEKKQTGADLSTIFFDILL